MSKREKIIIVLMLVAVIYGGLSYVLGSKSKNGPANPEKRKESLNKLVTNVAQNITENNLYKLDNYVVSRASEAWQDDPFQMPEVVVEAEKKSDEEEEQKDVSWQQVKLVYSGYLKIGDMILAIINGTEYGIGEPLDIPGFSVKNIAPHQVVVEVEGQIDNLILPLEEVQGPSGEETSELTS